MENDVHTRHCCIKHGCKYGSSNCTVTSGEKVQEYPCEQCDEEVREKGGRMKTARDTAAAIVNELFVNGFGEEATRLILEIEGKPHNNVCGWCKGAVRDIIIKHIK
jgi:hypothetical protein